MRETVTVLVSCRCGAEQDVRVYQHQADELVRDWLRDHDPKARPFCGDARAMKVLHPRPEHDPVRLAWVNRTLQAVDA